jgi:long-chain acyl-CoA synthetase
VSSPTLSPAAPAGVRAGAAAIVRGDERIGHDELWERVGRLAHALATRGIGQGDPVALLLPNTPDFAVAFLAIAQLRAVAVPLNPAFKKAELAFCLRDCGVRAVLTDGAGEPACRAIVPRVSPWGEAAEVVSSLDELMAGHEPLAPTPRPPDEVVVVQYSSGSTGRPKRVPRTHRQLRAEVEAYVAATGMTAADTVFCAIPLFHTYGLGCCLLAALRSGATLVLFDAPHPFALTRERALSVIEQERVTVIPAVPLIFRLLAGSNAEADLSAVRLCVSAGNALPRSTFDMFDRRFGIPIRQLYGLTETGAVSANLDADPDATAASVGPPLRGVEVAILDPAGDELPPDRIGEIVIRAAGMTDGYAGVPDEVNRDAFSGGWFRTGDRGRRDEAGRLFITGRSKLLIDAGGDKVDPIEVEDVLAVHPKVREVVVVGVASDVEGEELVKAVVVAGEPCSERELTRYCQERLANYKVPRMVEFREEIPRSSLGKVLRKYLV